MSADPLYGPNAIAPTHDDELSYPLGLSDASIREQLEKLAHHDDHDKTERRSQRRAPKDRMLRIPRRDR